MKTRVKAKWDQYTFECVYHGDRENILKAGDFDRHAIMIRNWKTGQRTTIDYWGEKIKSQKGVLRAFQKLCFQGLAASLDPEHFAKTLKLEFDNLATEVKYEEYKKVLNHLGNVLQENPMIIIVQMKEKGIDCGLDL